MVQSRVFQVLRFVALFAFSVALHADTFAKGVAGLRSEAISLVTDAAILVVIIGAIWMMMGGGMRALFPILGGIFVALNASNIVSFFQRIG